MATSPKRRKRPSMAAVRRALAEIEAAPRGRELPPELVKVIETYSPAGVPSETMDRIRPFLVEAITASTLIGAESVRKHCNHLTKLACFAMKRGIDLAVAQVLTTSLIDEYIRIEMAEESDHNRAERRTRGAAGPSRRRRPSTPR